MKRANESGVEDARTVKFNYVVDFISIVSGIWKSEKLSEPKIDKYFPAKGFVVSDVSSFTRPSFPSL